MAKFFVKVHEVHIATVEVEAPDGTSADDIRELATSKFEAGKFETTYDYTLDASEWPVFGVDGNRIDDKE